MNKLNVTVYLEVYNEEARLEECLRCFQWAKQLIVFDKSSTDRTREIALKYADEVMTTKYNSTSDNVTSLTSYLKEEWTLAITASSLMHPDLVSQISEITQNNNYEADVVGLPYRMYALGINDAHSPWYATHKYSLIRRSALQLSNVLHNEVSYSSKRVVLIQPATDQAYFYHLTHQTLDSFFERHVRYTRAEGMYLAKEYASNSKLALRRSFIDFLKSILTVFIRRRTYMLGWDGVVLIMGYISYYMMKFMYTWENIRSNRRVDYLELRKKISSAWIKE